MVAAAIAAKGWQPHLVAALQAAATHQDPGLPVPAIGQLERYLNQ